MTTVQAVYDGQNIRVLDTDKMAEYKRTLVEGRLLAMTLEYWEDARTRRQQGLTHEMLGRYARKINMAMVKLKDRLKTDLGYYRPVHKVLDGTLDLPEWNHRTVDLHAFYPDQYPSMSLIFLRSEATYTKRMEGELIDRIIAECKDNEVYIDDILRTLAELGGQSQ